MVALATSRFWWYLSSRKLTKKTTLFPATQRKNKINLWIILQNIRLPSFHETQVLVETGAERFQHQIYEHQRTLWMLRDFQCFITNTCLSALQANFHIEKLSRTENLISPSSAGMKKIHFSLFQIIALFGCWSGDFIREARGNFL